MDQWMDGKDLLYDTFFGSDMTLPALSKQCTEGQIMTRTHTTIMTIIIVSMIMIVWTIWGLTVSTVEQPAYDILQRSQSIEVRSYHPMIIAEVQVGGDRKKAISTGFKLLANYIFGHNTTNKKIAMTAPVQQQLSNHKWTISFVMPSKYSMDTLPTPKNKKVTLREIPKIQYVVITFSGLNSETNMSKHEQELKDYISTHHITVSGEPKYAVYNPPWTLPFMKRNEIMIKMAQ